MINAEITDVPQSVRSIAADITQRMRSLELNEAEAASIKEMASQRTRVKPEKGVKVTLPKDGAKSDITTTLTKAQAIELRNKLLVALQELNGPRGQQTVLLTLDNVQSLDIHTPLYRFDPYRYDRPVSHDARLTAERATFAFATHLLGEKDLTRLLHVFERPVIDIKAGRC